MYTTRVFHNSQHVSWGKTSCCWHGRSVARINKKKTILLLRGDLCHYLRVLKNRFILYNVFPTRLRYHGLVVPKMTFRRQAWDAVFKGSRPARQTSAVRSNKTSPSLLSKPSQKLRTGKKSASQTNLILRFWEKMPIMLSDTLTTQFTKTASCQKSWVWCTLAKALDDPSRTGDIWAAGIYKG